MSAFAFSGDARRSILHAPTASVARDQIDRRGAIDGLLRHKEQAASATEGAASKKVVWVKTGCYSQGMDFAKQLGLAGRNIPDRFAKGSVKDWSLFDDIRALGSVRGFVEQFQHTRCTVWNAVVGRTASLAQPHVFDTTGEFVPAFLSTGSTIYYRDMHTHVPAFSRFLRTMTSSLGFPEGGGKAEVLITFPGSGAGLHFDPLLVFNTQIFGEKQWWYHENRWVRRPSGLGGVAGDFDRPVTGNPVPKRMPATAKTVKATSGTTIFLPRGMIHKTKVLGSEPSLAVVFTITPTVVAEKAASNIHAALKSEARFRVDAPEHKPEQLFRAMLKLQKDIPARCWKAAVLGVPIELTEKNLSFASGVEVQSTSAGLLIKKGKKEVPLADVEPSILVVLRWIADQQRPIYALDALKHQWTDPVVLADIVEGLVKKKLMQRSDPD